MQQPRRRNLGVGESVRRLPEENRRRAPELRIRVIDAAANLLKERGYGATSLQRVSERAELSLGSVQHQFPTRAEMMIAIVNRAIEENAAEFASAVKDARDLTEAVHAVVEAGWRIIHRPLFLAALEIVSGTRSDPGLSPHMAAALRETDRLGMELIRAKGRDLGLELETAGETFLVLYRSMIRGLALDLAQATPEANCRRALDEFKLLLVQWVQEQVGGHAHAER